MSKLSDDLRDDAMRMRHHDEKLIDDDGCKWGGVGAFFWADNAEKAADTIDRMLAALPLGAREVMEAVISCTVPEGWSLYLDAEAEERLEPLYYLGLSVPERGGGTLGYPTFDGHWIIGRTLYATAQEMVDARVGREAS